MNNNEMKLKIISPPLSISIAFAHNNTTMKERVFLWLGVGVSLRFFISLLWFLFLVGESVEIRNNIYEWIDAFGIKSMRWDCRKHTLSFNLSLFSLFRDDLYAPSSKLKIEIICLWMVSVHRISMIMTWRIIMMTMMIASLQWNNEWNNSMILLLSYCCQSKNCELKERRTISHERRNQSLKLDNWRMNMRLICQDYACVRLFNYG